MNAFQRAFVWAGFLYGCSMSVFLLISQIRPGTAFGLASLLASNENNGIVVLGVVHVLLLQMSLWRAIDLGLQPILDAGERLVAIGRNLLSIALLLLISEWIVLLLVPMMRKQIGTAVQAELLVSSFLLPQTLYVALFFLIGRSKLLPGESALRKVLRSYRTARHRSHQV